MIFSIENFRVYKIISIDFKTIKKSPMNTRRQWENSSFVHAKNVPSQSPDRTRDAGRNAHKSYRWEIFYPECHATMEWKIKSESLRGWKEKIAIMVNILDYNAISIGVIAKWLCNIIKEKKLDLSALTKFQ